MNASSEAPGGRSAEPQSSNGKAGTASSALLDGALRIALVATLVFACARILLPFIGVLCWSAILAVMIYPLHVRLVPRLGNRKSATLIGVVGVLVLFVPLVVGLTSLGGSIIDLVQGIQNDTLVVPGPPEQLAAVPFIGKKLSDSWALLASNAPAALVKYGPQLKSFATWLAKFGGSTIGSGMSFIFSLGISAILIAYAKPGIAFAHSLFARITGDAGRASRLLGLTTATIRGVAQGVLGVAMVQAVLVGIGFFAIGLPGAGALTLVVLLLGIAQVPGFVVTLPAVAYVFTHEPTTPALIFTVWSVIAGSSDNILKPLLLGRGLEVPMPVILLGVIGGMVADGLIGLFIGPVILAVGYLLFIDWVEQAGQSKAKAE